MKYLGTVLAVIILFSLVGAMPASAASLPSDAGYLATQPATFNYYVIPGDTLSKVAGRFGTTIWALLRLNPGITNPNRIYVGQRLLIPQPAGTSTKVKIALISVNSGGSIGCGDSVVVVERQVAPTRAPLTAAIRELLSIKQQYYGQSGLYNALYQSNLAIQSVAIVNGKATIKLTGQLTLGGVCDNPRTIAQFEQTARQFSTVSSVEVYINGTLLQTLLSGAA